MSKMAQSFAKYVVYAKLDAKGVVEKPDVIGAIFGQTEGLLGADLDLRELQHTGRIGRIEVNVETVKGKSQAEIIIPSSLDASETALIAASLETIDKVGPCDAQILVSKVEDVRTQKRKFLIERAKELLRSVMDEGMPSSQKLSEVLKESVRTLEVSDFNGLACGPDVLTSEEMIVVEGRADVINLLKHGIRNAIAIEGSKIPQAVVDLTKEKTTIAFLDGDRGGDLDLKRLLSIAEIDFVCRADAGEEVEDLTKKQIFKALREKVAVKQIGSEQVSSEKIEVDAIKHTGMEDTEVVAAGVPLLPGKTPEIATPAYNQRYQRFKRPDYAPPENAGASEQKLLTLLEDLVGTRAAYLVNREGAILHKLPLSELGMFDDYGNVATIVFDGKVNQDIVDLAQNRRIGTIVGMGYKERVKPNDVKILTMKSKF
ncbi:MAG: DNA primase [Candidatus Aenigmarchaeota archaeon]|nr:DNA primase [Candidatus Aenigmarchaeota archaeon]